MLPTSSLSTRNQILRSVSPYTLHGMLRYLEPVTLPVGYQLYRAFEPIPYVFFPDSAMGSIVANSESGHCTEVGMVGYESGCGLEVIMGADSSPHDVAIQIAGTGHKMATAAIREEFSKCSDFQASLLTSVNNLMVQISQTTLCNRLHSVEQRLSRWLLMCQDRSATEELCLTHEFLATRLGATRVSITQAAGQLQQDGQITYSRGKISIIDRQALANISCECYETVRSGTTSIPPYKSRVRTDDPECPPISDVPFTGARTDIA
jgi:CRP-like cAMP-binding protein